jgi:hypothetical protein
LSLHVTVGDRSVIYRILGDLSGLPPSAFDSSAVLHGAEMTLEFFDTKTGRAVATLGARLLAGGHRELELLAPSDDTVPTMRRIATRLEERLPDWPSSDEALAGMGLCDAATFYGRPGARGYRTVSIFEGHSERHADEALVLLCEMAFRHDPARAVRFHRSSRRERDLVVGPETPPADYLRGPEGKMRVAPEYTSAACQQVVCVDAGELSAHLRFPGPTYAFVARGPREAAIDLAREAMAIHRGEAALDPPVQRIAALMGLSRAARTD